MKKRESFNNKWGFVLACIGSAVGMGNIWMFPTRVSLYGGGSYLIPYFHFRYPDRIHRCDRRNEFRTCCQIRSGRRFRLCL